MNGPAIDLSWLEQGRQQKIQQRLRGPIVAAGAEGRASKPRALSKPKKMQPWLTAAPTSDYEWEERLWTTNSDTETREVKYKDPFPLLAGSHGKPLHGPRGHAGKEKEGEEIWKTKHSTQKDCFNYGISERMVTSTFRSDKISNDFYFLLSFMYCFDFLW